jgi:hypothetical protein
MALLPALVDTLPTLRLQAANAPVAAAALQV